MHQLIICRESTFHKDYVFDDVDCLVLGRALSSDVLLPDASRRVSRQHAALLRCPDRPGSFFIRDLGSLRGTRVNGETVFSVLLQDGDNIRIGDYDLLYSSRAPSDSEKLPLRVVGSRKAADDPNAGTAAFERQTFVEEMPLSNAETEVVEAVLQAQARGETLPRVLRSLLPAAMAVCGARRAFAALFRPGPAPFEVAERAGLRPGDQIEITDDNYMERLQGGNSVHDGQTVLIPIIDGNRPVGFFCLDRSAGDDVFDTHDAAFLSMIGRLAASRTENGTMRLASSTRFTTVFEWPFHLIGCSNVMRELRTRIREAAADDANILLMGESGTGKEIAAQMIHKLSPFAEGPFIAQNCAALSESLAETEMFGYAANSGIQGAERGGAPGWFELANNGILFLDELQGLSLGMQDKFLRVLQDKKVWRISARRATTVQMKILAASDKDLDAAVQSGTLRGPLFFRFSRRIQLPPLREHKEDITLLAFYFLDSYVRKQNSCVRTLSHRAVQALAARSWSGNVRELKNCIETACGRGAGRDVVFSWDLSAGWGEFSEEATGESPSIREMEKQKIMEILETTNGNISRACRLLGYKSRQTILNKMDRFGIPRSYGDPGSHGLETEMQ